MAHDGGFDLDLIGRQVEAIFPEALGVWVHGSIATGRAGAASDLDLAVLGAEPIPTGLAALDRLSDLSMRVGREVDLVDLRAAPPALWFEVFAHGQRVAARDPLLCDRFEMTAISQYQRLNVERREIFGAIRERGTVY